AEANPPAVRAPRTGRSGGRRGGARAGLRPADLRRAAAAGARGEHGRAARGPAAGPRRRPHASRHRASRRVCLGARTRANLPRFPGPSAPSRGPKTTGPKARLVHSLQLEPDAEPAPVPPARSRLKDRDAGAARRYARALLDVAVARKDEGLRADLERLAALYAAHADLRHVLLHPALPAEKKRAVV